MYWISPSNHQINNVTNPFRALTPQQLRQQYHQRLAEGREGLSSNDLAKLKNTKTNAFPTNRTMNYKETFDWILRNGVKMGDWVGQSFFYYDGNVWMLKSGKATNDGSIKDFRRKVNKSVVTELEPKLTEIEKMAKSGEISVGESVELDEALPGILKVKPNSPDWMTAELQSTKQVLGKTGTKKFKIGDNISIHPFDGDRFVGAVDKNDPGTYFFVAKYSVKPIREETQHLDEAMSDIVDRDIILRDLEEPLKKYHGQNWAAFKKMVELLYGNKSDISRADEMDRDYDFTPDMMMAIEKRKLPKLPQSFFRRLGGAELEKDALKMKVAVPESFDPTINEAKVPSNLLGEFDKLINKYRDSGLKGADSFDKKTILNDELELRNVLSLLKKGQIDKAWDAYENLDSELQMNVVPDRVVQFMDKNLSEGAKEIHKKLMQKGVVAPIDTTRHPKRKGLEGPYRSRKSGKVFYYDPKEGKYYDADSDIYLDVDDVMEEGEERMDEAVAKKREKFKAGVEKWFGTVFTGLPKYPTQQIYGWKTELETGSGMPGYVTYVLHSDGLGTYTVYEGGGYPKVKIRGDKPLGKFRSPEEAMDFVKNRAMSEGVEEETQMVDEARFTSSMIDKLRKEYGKIDKIDPSNKSYKKLIDMLNNMSKDQLKSLIDAKPPVKFLSKLAFNRFNRMQNPKDYPSDQLGEQKTDKDMIDAVNKMSKDELKKLMRDKKNPMAKLAFRRFNRMQNPKDYPSDKLDEEFNILLDESNVVLNITEDGLDESIDLMRKIMKSGSRKSLRFDEGGSITVDRVSATALVTLYDALNRANKKKLEETFTKSKKLFIRMVDFALSKVRIREEYTWDETRAAYVRVDGEEGPMEVPVLIDKGNPVADEVPNVNKYANTTERDLRKALGESSSDSAMVRELVLFIVNDSDTYRARIQPIIKNLARKIKAGKFDETLAVKGFMYAVEHGIKNYIKEFGNIGKVDKSTKNEVASELLDRFMEEINDEA